MNGTRSHLHLLGFWLHVNLPFSEKKMLLGGKVSHNFHYLWVLKAIWRCTLTHLCVHCTKLNCPRVELIIPRLQCILELSCDEGQFGMCREARDDTAQQIAHGLVCGEAGVGEVEDVVEAVETGVVGGEQRHGVLAPLHTQSSTVLKVTKEVDRTCILVQKVCKIEIFVYSVCIEIAG